MNLHRKSCLLLCLGLATAFSVRAELVFTGVLVQPAGSTFGLTDTATGLTKWIALGESFSGWKIDSYDAGAAKLKMTKDGVARLLILRNTVLKQAPPTAIAGHFRIKMGGRAVEQDTTFTPGQMTAISLNDGTTLTVTPAHTRDPNTILYQMSVERGTLADGKTANVIARPMVVATPGGGFTVAISGGKTGDFSFTFTPKPATVATPAAIPALGRG